MRSTEFAMALPAIIDFGMPRTLPVLFVFLFPVTLFAQQWPQWGADPQHQSQVAVPGQALERNLVATVYDTLAPQEIFSTGNLLVHYQAPLVDGNDVYMMFKRGRFDASTWTTQDWAETKYTWQNGTLAAVWQFWTDWQPPGRLSDFWEPVFHPVLANGVLYVPGAGGSIYKVNRQTGIGIRINPFPSLNVNAFVVSPLTIDSAGNILYNVIELQPGFAGFFQRDVVDSWLVRIAPNDAAEKVSYSVLATGAPGGTQLCLDQFTNEPLPWPPSTTAVPNSIVCGTQRPGMNIAPAVAPNGTMYVVTRAHFSSRWAYLIAVTPDLKQKWITTLRDRLTDGCGVPRFSGGVLPPNGAPGGCRVDSLLGVDPSTNTLGGGRVNDNGSSSPVVAPDGSIIYGAFTRYNYSQGHLMRFSSDGVFLGAYPFGWDITPAIYEHDGTWSIVTKDNRYAIGSYCSEPVNCPFNRTATHPEYAEGYYITQLNSAMQVEWSFRNLNTQNCARQPDGTIRCNPGPSESFEWCVNAFVVDKDGVVYANSEDGWLYAIAQGGTMKHRIFQQLALGAAYTPTSMDSGGRVYSQNAGIMFVAGTTPPPPIRRRTAPHR